MNEAPTFIVRLPSGIAIKFHKDRVRNIYETATDLEATPFDLAADANATAVNYGLRIGHFTVEQLNQK